MPGRRRSARDGADLDASLAAAGLPALPRSAWLTIDLSRIASNLAVLRAALPRGTRIDPVVKADAYGHGAVPVAHTLAAAGADGLCVATFDEAMELRSSGLDLPILVLYPIPPSCAAEAARNRLAVSVGDERLLARTLAALEASGRPKLAIQVEIETGLGRGGLVPERALVAARLITGHPLATLAGAWSHLGSPDDAGRSGRQTETFDATAALLAADGAIVESWHLAASGGLLAAAAGTYDGIRPGLAVYGVVPEGLPVDPARLSAALALQPALALHARPVRVAALPEGTGISYGLTYVTSRPSRIATLPLGYADGYSRVRTGRVEALVRGRRVPVVGTIAMDALMVDVTDVPGPAVDVDDEFVLLGEQGGERIAAAELARAGTTISWEVLSTMARRLPRVYYAASGPIGLRTLTVERGTWWKPGTRTTALPGRTAEPGP